ncbi:MAG: SusC/RagA family TonB-linked outer membrane protein, partial [Pedobacter sp.]
MEKKFYKSSLITSGNYLVVLILLFTSLLNSAYALPKNLPKANLTHIKCSIKVNNQSLEEVFNLIQKQTPYNIICVDKSGFLKKKLSINALNSNLGSILERMSSSVPFTYNEMSNKIIVKPVLIKNSEEERVVRGHVTDAKNQGVPGVSVLIKGSNTGTVTNQDGNFSIKANTGDILVVSSLGFNKTEVTVTELDTYTIQLTDDEQALSEVVVTALGIKKEKAKLGYAVQEVQGESLIKAREPNIINSLTGRVAGLNIRNSTDLFTDPGIFLRGRKPLIVIDGIPDQSADLYKVNADDIETLTVLKGAGASALYGSIGQNGAIMITTKRGKGKDLSIDVNSSTQIQPSFIRIPEVQT